LLREDLEQDPARVCLHLLRHLLGVELVERVTLLDLVALGFQPADDRAGFHALAEPGKHDLVAHSLPTARLIAASTSWECGMTYSSIIGAKGSGEKRAPTRWTGASR